jgi:hypothetical protein
MVDNPTNPSSDPAIPITVPVEKEDKKKKKKKKKKSAAPPPTAPPPPPPKDAPPKVSTDEPEGGGALGGPPVAVTLAKEGPWASFFTLGCLSEAFQTAETARLEEKGMSWSAWGRPAPALLSSLQVSRGSSSPPPGSLIPVEWVVEVQMSEIETSSGSHNARYSEDGWVIATACGFDERTGALNVAVPDRQDPSWEGSVLAVGRELCSPGSNRVRLVECCDSAEENPASWALYSTLLRANLVRVDWPLEWVRVGDGRGGNIRASAGEDAGKCAGVALSGRAEWFSRITNQMLCTLSTAETLEIVDLAANAAVTLFGVGRSGEGSTEFDAVARQGIVRIAGHPKYSIPYTEWSAVSPSEPADPPTPAAFLREQLELLMHYQNEMKRAMESARMLRDQAILDQHEMMEQLRSFVFEGDLVNGHKVLDLLNRHADGYDRARRHTPDRRHDRSLLHPDQIAKRVHDIEEDLWHVVTEGVLGASARLIRYEVGAPVRVLFRSGSCWEAGVIEQPGYDSSEPDRNQEHYDVRVSSDASLLEGVPVQYIEPLGEPLTSSTLLESASSRSCMTTSPSGQKESNYTGPGSAKSGVFLDGSSPEMLRKPQGWLATERARLLKELNARRRQRSKLERLVEDTEKARMDSHRQQRGASTDAQSELETLAQPQAAHTGRSDGGGGGVVGASVIDDDDDDDDDDYDYADWWKGDERPRRGEVVIVHFSNGWFWGRVLRARCIPIEERGAPEWVFDVGFDGDYVEKELPVDRLAPPKYDDGDGSGRRQEEGERLRNSSEGIDPVGLSLLQDNAKQLRVVTCSLNMSKMSFDVTSTDGATALDEWLVPGGHFDCAVLESLDECADIVVVALQDSPSATIPHDSATPQDRIIEQLGRDVFHLAGVVQRYKGGLQLLVFVRGNLIPIGGTAGMTPRSFALGLGVDDSLFLERTVLQGNDGEGKREDSETSTTAAEVCGALAFQLQIAGTTLRFIACRLGHGQMQPATDIRKGQVRRITEAVDSCFSSSADAFPELAQHCFLLGDLGSRIDLRADTMSETEHSALLLGLAKEGPSGWQRLYAGDDLHVGLGKQTLLEGFVTPDCDQFKPIFDEMCAVWNPHYGARCLVKSLSSCAGDIVCREYKYMATNPTARKHEKARSEEPSTPPPPPQLPLRACFHIKVGETS